MGRTVVVHPIDINLENSLCFIIVTTANTSIKLEILLSIVSYTLPRIKNSLIS